MTQIIDKADIKAIECRFAVHCAGNNDDPTDMHVVKEVIHTNDGRQIPNVRLIKNFQRPYWVTKKGFQNHTQKKEWELLERLEPYKSTQTELVWNAAKSLGTPWFRGDLRKLSSSPYLYGSDILSTAVIKKMYQDKYPDTQTPFSLACFDTEADVVKGTDEILMATLSKKEKVFTAIQKSFVEGYSDVEARLQELLVKYLGEYVEKRKIVWEVLLVDSETDVIIETVRRGHIWKPDFIAIWNINYDMPKMLEALKKRGIDPAEVFSDPSVPERFRHFHFKQGKNKKVTASGKVSPIKPPAQWHTVFTPSSFYFMDAMCAYRHIRTGNAEEPSYSLDAILQKHLGIRKLKFEMAEGLSGIEWHQFMQTRYPLEYVIYNVFDCISMEELDEKTKDLQMTLPMMSGCSDFENFKSQPRRTADALHYFCLENNRAIGSTSGEMADELDKLTLGLDGWIVTLPAHLVMENGLQIIEEAPELRTNIRGHVGDLDVSASYPNGGCVFNISKETTKTELCRIRDVSETVQRMQGINLSGGHTNAVEFCTGMFKMPTMEQMLDAFNKSRTF